MIWRRVSFGVPLLLLLAGAAGDAGAQQVTLPLEKFEALRARANPGAETPPPPPAPYALELAEYAVKVSRESARVVQTLRLTLFDDQWQTVPMGEAGSFIGADFHGAEGRVAASDKGAGGLILYLRGRGAHEVRLESATAVSPDETATRPTWRFSLGFPAAAVVRGRIDAPATIEEIDPEGSGLIQKDTAKGAAGWTFVALPATTVRWTLSGKAVVPVRSQLPLRFEATSATASTLSRTGLAVAAWIEARVAQGELEKLTIPVPFGLKVVNIRGSYAGWNVEGGKLIITPLGPIAGSLALEVELSGEPHDRFATPLLLPEGSTRTRLLVKAALKGDGILTLFERGGTRPPGDQEEGRLPESLRSVKATLLAVTDPEHPPVWEAAWAERSEVLAAQVDRLLVDVALGEAGKASYQVWAEVRNRGAQQLTLNPPAGFELAGARRDGAAVVPGIVPGVGGNSLAVPLLTQEAAQVVYLSGVIPLALPQKDGTIQLQLPSLSAPVARVEVRLLVPGGRSYALVESARAGGVSPPPGTAPRRAVSGLGAQANAQINSASTAASPAAVLPGLFSLPAGFTEVQAAWSALSPAPAPLSLRVEAEKEKREWF
jgi:hypothetical protein